VEGLEQEKERKVKETPKITPIRTRLKTKRLLDERYCFKLICNHLLWINVKIPKETSKTEVFRCLPLSQKWSKNTNPTGLVLGRLLLIKNQPIPWLHTLYIGKRPPCRIPQVPKHADHYT
jgi:hypothetical protein